MDFAGGYTLLLKVKRFGSESADRLPEVECLLQLVQFLVRLDRLPDQLEQLPKLISESLGVYVASLVLKRFREQG